jgi:hypothetical protein
MGTSFKKSPESIPHTIIKQKPHKRGDWKQQRRIA